ncbi:MAG TPA: MBL fold metallo-hydrolase [Bacteroidales bacterium]|nr:MBL fold metallo-hydrolase [Bacteroidales bacterium]
MKITFLGTGTSQGIPVIACDCKTCSSSDTRDKRLRASLLVELEGKTMVIDAGPDFRQQMLREDVRQLDAILLTHEHIDHIGGMDDVRAFNFKSNKAIDIFSDERVQKAIERQYTYVFSEAGYPGAPKMNLHLISDNPIDLFGTFIYPIKVFHHKLPVYGFRIGEMAYITDANFISPESKVKLSGIRHFIINALRKEKHLSHYSLDEALDLINEIAPEFAYITHVGHTMGLHEEVTATLPSNVMLAYDGLCFIC